MFWYYYRVSDVLSRNILCGLEYFPLTFTQIIHQDLAQDTGNLWCHALKGDFKIVHLCDENILRRFMRNEWSLPKKQYPNTSNRKSVFWVILECILYYNMTKYHIRCNALLYSIQFWINRITVLWLTEKSSGIVERILASLNQRTFG